jgi:hypothetical protein
MIKRSLALCCLAVGLLGMAGCESKPEGRKLVGKDIPTMTDMMYRDITARVASVNATNPNKIVVVVYPMISQDGKDWGLLTSRIAMLLNRNANPNIAFVEKRAVTESIQGAELGGGGGDPHEDANRYPPGGPPAPNRLMPTFALHGEVQRAPLSGSTFYLFNFKLTRIAPDGRAGEIVWNNGYEVDVSH